MIEIYTDGSCIRNPGPGGWAAIVVSNGDQRSVEGGDHDTTNNRMEMTAVIEGLKAVPRDQPVTVLSDSQYIVNTMVRGWKRKANLDLWDLLDGEVRGRSVSWRWIRGHAGNPMNEKADDLARAQAYAYAGGSQPPAPNLSHVDRHGKGSMVDVGHKPATERVAEARGSVRMKPGTLALIRDNAVKKGDVLGIAMIAGITGAKATSSLIPLCHPLPLDQVTVEFELNPAESSVAITATAKTTAKTGVEMEALTAVTVAALTIYDMCKSADREMTIEAVRLVRKTGGRSGDLVLE